MLDEHSTDYEIQDFFDQNWNVTLQEIASMTGKTIDQLKSILMR